LEVTCLHIQEGTGFARKLQAIIQAGVDKEDQARMLLERKSIEDERKKIETWVSTHFRGL
jgi:hypothetical protein